MLEEKSPGFTAIAVVSLALGIGANTIIFSLAKAALLDELAVPHPEQLRLFTLEIPPRNSPIHGFWGSFYPRESRGEWKRHRLPTPCTRSRGGRTVALRTFSPSKSSAVITGSRPRSPSHAQVVTGQLVPRQLLPGTGGQVQLSRPARSRPSDDVKPGQGQVAVISDGFWARAWGRSPSVIGKTIELNLIPMSVIGVNYPDFTGAARVQSSPDVFVPLTMQPILLPKREESLLTDSKTWWVQMVGRAKPEFPRGCRRHRFSVTLDQADPERRCRLRKTQSCRSSPCPRGVGE